MWEGELGPRGRHVLGIREVCMGWHVWNCSVRCRWRNSSGCCLIEKAGMQRHEDGRDWSFSGTPSHQPFWTWAFLKCSVLAIKYASTIQPSDSPHMLASPSSESFVLLQPGLACVLHTCSDNKPLLRKLPYLMPFHYFGIWTFPYLPIFVLLSTAPFQKTSLIIPVHVDLAQFWIDFVFWDTPFWIYSIIFNLGCLMFIPDLFLSLIML